MRAFGRVRHHLGHRPLHVGAQCRAKLGVIGQPRVIRGLHETCDEAVADVAVRTLTGMDGDHPGVTTALVGKAPRPTEYLGPVVAQPLHMLWVARVGERMVQDGVGEAALMMRSCQRLKGWFTACELEERGTCHRCTVTQ